MDVSVANRNVSMPIVSPVKTGSFAHFSNSTREKAQTTYRIPSKSYKTNHIKGERLSTRPNGLSLKKPSTQNLTKGTSMYIFSAPRGPWNKDDGGEG